MTSQPSSRSERIHALTSESRWWHSIGFVYAVLGMAGVGVGIPLSLVHGEEEYGVPLVAFGAAFLLAAWRSHEGGDAYLDQSFRVFDRSDS